MLFAVNGEVFKSKRMPIVELKKMLGLIDNKGNEQLKRINNFK